MRKWLPNFAELIDRLSIHQLKEVFIPEHKEKYHTEMNDIMHDLNLIISDEKIALDADFIRLTIIISQINTHIWYNESKARNAESQDSRLLFLTHSLNGLRNRAMNIMLDKINSNRKDYKIDCLAAEFAQWQILYLEAMSKRPADEFDLNSKNFELQGIAK